MSNYNWNDKEDRARFAQDHTKEMQIKYRDEIYAGIRNTIIFDQKVPKYTKREDVEQNILLVAEDSVSAIFNHAEGKTAVLNFASYKNPGGMFIKGAKAQEECLCYESYLYNVLNMLENSFYAYNKKNLNKGLYTDRALYTPDVRFFKDEESIMADVLTCAAPNNSLGIRYGAFSKDENEKTLAERIAFVLDISSSCNVDTLILGAWGCGVFKQNPQVVAKLFMEKLKEHKDIKNIIFAIPDENSKNYKEFVKEVK